MLGRQTYFGAAARSLPLEGYFSIDLPIAATLAAMKANTRQPPSAISLFRLRAAAAATSRFGQYEYLHDGLPAPGANKQKRLRHYDNT